MLSQEVARRRRKQSSAVGWVMDASTKQIVLAVLGSIREDLTYSHLNNGNRILDVADLRRYIYEQMDRIRKDASMNGIGRQLKKERARGEKAHRNGGQKQNVVSMPGKRTMSAAARKKIAAAQRARWAKVRAQKKSA